MPVGCSRAGGGEKAGRKVSEWKRVSVPSSECRYLKVESRSGRSVLPPSCTPVYPLMSVSCPPLPSSEQSAVGACGEMPKCLAFRLIFRKNPIFPHFSFPFSFFSLFRNFSPEISSILYFFLSPFSSAPTHSLQEPMSRVKREQKRAETLPLPPFFGLPSLRFALRRLPDFPHNPIVFMRCALVFCALKRTEEVGQGRVWRRLNLKGFGSAQITGWEKSFGLEIGRFAMNL